MDDNKARIYAASIALRISLTSIEKGSDNPIEDAAIVAASLSHAHREDTVSDHYKKISEKLLVLIKDNNVDEVHEVVTEALKDSESYEILENLIKKEE